MKIESENILFVPSFEPGSLVCMMDALASSALFFDRVIVNVTTLGELCIDFNFSIAENKNKDFTSLPHISTIFTL
jgi:hypothetical protein